MSGERNFAPTRERLRRAAREGDVARSPDLTSLAAFAAGCGALAALFGPMNAAAQAALRQSARGAAAGGPYLVLGASAAALCAAAAAGAVSAALAQAGSLTVTLPALKFSRLNPIAGIKRIVSLQSALAIAKAVLATAALACAVAPVARDVAAAAARGADARTSATFVAAALPRLALALAATGAAFAIGDLAVQHRSRRKRLRMTFQEYKDDLKASDGDPLLRARRRGVHRSLLRGSIDRLPEAAFVVVNPQHVAVALEYDPPRVEVPRVLLRARDRAALEVRRRAGALEIPIVEDVELARALDARSEPGDYIPRDLYGPVARIVAALARALTA
jgi:flagellar biosynthetic protein FlhB